MTYVSPYTHDVPVLWRHARLFMERLLRQFAPQRRPKPEPKPVVPEGRAIAGRIEALRRVPEDPAPAFEASG